MTGQDRSGRKKTDHIQIRVAPENQAGVSGRLQGDRVSVSNVLRQAIGDYLAGRKQAPPNGVRQAVPGPLRKRRYLAAGVAGLGLALFAAMPSAAEPDFAAAFKRLDRDGDGAWGKHEFNLQGPDGERYTQPVGRYETADGFGVEVWESPLGVRVGSMSLKDVVWLEPTYDVLRTRPDRSAGAWRGLADTDHNGELTLNEFETYFRGHAKKVFEASDTDGDGVVSDAEIEALAHPQESNPDFQGGPGGLAMRAKRAEVTMDVLRSFDLNGDHKLTPDEALEAWLGRLVRAYAPEQ